jgi:hypothetical protein
MIKLFYQFLLQKVLSRFCYRKYPKTAPCSSIFEEKEKDTNILINSKYSIVFEEKDTIILLLILVSFPVKLLKILYNYLISNYFIYYLSYNLSSFFGNNLSPQDQD